NQHIFKVTPIPDVDKQFFFYFMKSLMPTFTAIASNKQTTGLGHVTVKDLKELVVEVPPMDIQTAIGACLQSMDDKITNNTKINHHLVSARVVTESSPDIRRGRRVSRSSASLMFSSWLETKALAIGASTRLNFPSISSSGRSNAMPFTRSLGNSVCPVLPV
ncbi:MAG: restriction endonuclease subunit S, partial [Bacteroidaceae bacterium]